MPPVLYNDAMSYTEVDHLKDGLLVQLEGIHRNSKKLSRSLNDFEEHVVCGLRQRFRHLENQGIAKKPNEEILREFGFNTGSSVSLAILQQCSRADNHLELIDWVVIYVQDVIRYKLPVAYNSTRFPYQETTVNRWFRIDPGDIENQEERAINVINIDAKGKKKKFYSPQYGLAFPDQLVDDEHKLYFHGTDHESAEKIIKTGIDLWKGKTGQDFSNGQGFYLNDKFQEAETWAFHKSRRPAVLVYKANIQALHQYEDNSVNLCGEENEERWLEVVRQFRSHKPEINFRREMKNKTYIEGPIASFGRNVSLANIDCIEAREGSYQMCLISEELAEKFDNFLHSIMFYNTI